MAAILATIINKTDKNDARGIAEALRVGHFRECVHRSDDAVEIRSLLHLRQTAIEERTHVINSLRGHLKVYGIKFGKKAGKTFRKMVEADFQLIPFPENKAMKWHWVTRQIWMILKTAVRV